MNEKHPEKCARFPQHEQSIPSTEVGTFRCRALHSNHWQAGSTPNTARKPWRSRKAVPDIPEQEAYKSGGRGYYRNVSLVNVWDTAPFMHNNAIGPELCGNPQNRRRLHAGALRRCKWAATGATTGVLSYDASVDGRFKLYTAIDARASDPSDRGTKMTLTTNIVLGRHTALGRQRGKSAVRFRASGCRKDFGWFIAAC